MILGILGCYFPIVSIIFPMGFKPTNQPFPHTSLQPTNGVGFPDSAVGSGSESLEFRRGLGVDGFFP